MHTHTHISHVYTHTHAHESCHTYGWVMPYVWKRRATHIKESCHVYEWVIPHTKNGSCHTYERSCHTYAWVMAHISMHHVTHINESCHTYIWVMPHIWMSHGTHMNGSWWMLLAHTWKLPKLAETWIWSDTHIHVVCHDSIMCEKILTNRIRMWFMTWFNHVWTDSRDWDHSYHGRRRSWIQQSRLQDCFGPNHSLETTPASFSDTKTNPKIWSLGLVFVIVIHDLLCEWWMSYATRVNK